MESECNHCKKNFSGPIAVCFLCPKGSSKICRECSNHTISLYHKLEEKKKKLEPVQEENHPIIVEEAKNWCEHCGTQIAYHLCQETCNQCGDRICVNCSRVAHKYDEDKEVGFIWIISYATQPYECHSYKQDAVYAISHLLGEHYNKYKLNDQGDIIVWTNFPNAGVELRKIKFGQ